MRRITASKLGLAYQCLYPWSPAAEWVDVPGDSAKLGTAFHKYPEIMLSPSFERKPSSAEFAATADVLDEQRPVLRRMIETWLEQWYSSYGSATWKPEVVYYFDPSTGLARAGGSGIDRDYRPRPGELSGTADAVFVDENLVTVIDWKTGMQSNLKPAAKNSQLRFLAMCAANVERRTRARVVVVHVGEDEITDDAAMFDVFELADVEAEVKELAATMAGGGIVPCPGTWCVDMWCPCAATCPATRQAVQELAPESEQQLPVVATVEGIQSKAHAATIYHRLRAIDAMRDQAWAALKAYVDVAGPVPLGDGSSYQAVEESRESFVVDSEALTVLGEKFGDRAKGAVKSTVTKTSIAEIAREVAGPGKPGAALEREVLGALRAAGCSRSKTISTHERVKAKKEAA